MNALRIRLKGHRSDIRHKCTRKVKKPVAKHFNSVDHSIKDLVIMVIKMIHREDAEYSKKENHWIEMITSLTSNGLNLYL